MAELFQRDRIDYSESRLTAALFSCKEDLARKAYSER